MVQLNASRDSLSASSQLQQLFADIHALRSGQLEMEDILYIEVSSYLRGKTKSLLETSVSDQRMRKIISVGRAFITKIAGVREITSAQFVRALKNWAEKQGHTLPADIDSVLRNLWEKLFEAGLVKLARDKQDDNYQLKRWAVWARESMRYWTRKACEIFMATPANISEDDVEDEALRHFIRGMNTGAAIHYALHILE